MDPHRIPGRAAALCGALAIGIAGCPGSEEAADAAPEAGPTLAAHAPIPAARRCGQAGPTATERPPDVTGAPVNLGRTRIAVDSAHTVGDLTIRRSAKVWEDVTSLSLAVASGGDGQHTQILLEPHTQRSVAIGRYTVAVLASADADPTVDVGVEARPCPIAALLQRSDAPQSLWLSPDGIRRHSVDPDGETFALTLRDADDPPMLVVEGPHHNVALPVDATPHTPVRVNDWSVQIDRVEREDAVHVRATVQRIAPRDPPAVTSEATRCAEPTPHPTQPPLALAKPAPVVGDDHIRLGDRIEAGPLEITMTNTRPRSEDFELVAHDRDTGLRRQASFGFAGTNMSVMRLGRSVVRATWTGPTEVHIQRVKNRCPPSLAVANAAAPTYVWLSSIGLGLIRLESEPEARVELIQRTRTPRLRARDAQTDYSRTLEPSAVGDVFSVGEHVFEIVSVEASAGAWFDGERWRSRATIPAVHVQLRLSPAKHLKV